MAGQEVMKYYPVQGTNKFQTVSFPITKAFHVDFGAGTTTLGTVTLQGFKKGSIILGFAARVVEAYESTGSGTFQLGFASTQMLSSAIASGVAVLNAVLRPSSTAATTPLVLTANDTFDFIPGTSVTASAGKVDVYVTYIPMPDNNLTTGDFVSYTVSS